MVPELKEENASLNSKPYFASFHMDPGELSQNRLNLYCAPTPQLFSKYYKNSEYHSPSLS